MTTLTYSAAAEPRRENFLKTLLRSISRGVAAHRAFEDLNALTDAQLARRGMTRADIAARVQAYL